MSDSAIRAEVARILASSDFDVPDRAKRFLTYIVEEMIVGRGDRIKAYSIATEVFGRDSSFDAQADPVVRIEAGRVRRALEHYYLTAGREDEVLMTIPKGSYLPHFAVRTVETKAPLPGIPQSEHHEIAVKPAAITPSLPSWARLAFAVLVGLAVILAIALLISALALRDMSSARARASLNTEAPDVPRILVRPFEDLTGTPASAVLAKGLTEEIIGRIAEFRELIVMTAPQGSDPKSSPDVGHKERYVLEGSVRLEGARVRLTAKVVSNGAVLWANIYEDDLDVRAILEVQDDIASHVATAIAQPYGVIFQSDSTRVAANAPDDWSAYACTLSYYTYRAKLDSKVAEAVLECLEQSVARFPEYATAWAMLSLVNIDRLRYRNNPDSAVQSPLDRAEIAADRAVELDPENARALQARMMVLSFKQDIEAALLVGERAVSINPNDSELIGEYGIRLATSGEWARGAGFITKAIDLNPTPSAPLEASLALCLYMLGDYQNAATWIRRSDIQVNPIYHLIAAPIYGQLGDAAASERERAWLLENAPDLVRNLRQEFAMRNMKPADQSHFVDGLRKAGFSIRDF